MGVASLLCALYPCLPNTSLDNRYHLQALRHLYVLAARPGVLVTRHMDTEEPCCVPLQVSMQGGQVRDLVTPCLLQDWDKIEQVRGGRSEGGGVSKGGKDGGREEEDRRREGGVGEERGKEGWRERGGGRRK